MLFTSFGFLFLFLPVVVVLFWLVPRGTGRLLFLVAASLVFYGLWDWRYVPLLLATTLVDWVAGRIVAGMEDGRRRKLVLAAAVAVNLGLLGYFKYRGFFGDQLNGLFELAGLEPPLGALRLLLPVGISFYTFAGISYLVDVYRGTTRPARSVVHYLAWVTLFPSIMAGPILRYGHVGAQLERLQQRFELRLVGTGLFFLVLGMAKKVLVADMMAPYVDTLFANSGDLGLLSGWGAALGYTLQLYFDFSGYSDMAVGIAFLLGLRYPQNFDSPYRSENVSQFWRRWHITLGAWLRDYVFIPLGGSRGSQLATVRNLLITFLLGGLWHGAAWTFVIWGLLWGVYLSVHAVLRSRGLTPRWSWFNRLVTFACATVAWVFFRAASVGDAGEVLAAMAGLRGVAGAGLERLAPVLAGLIVFGLLWVNLAPNTWQLKPAPKLRWALVLGVLLGASLLALSKPSPFLYFQF